MEGILRMASLDKKLYKSQIDGIRKKYPNYGNIWSKEHDELFRDKFDLILAFW